MDRPKDGTIKRWPIHVGAIVRVKTFVAHPRLDYTAEVTAVHGGVIRLLDRRGHIRFSHASRCKVQPKSGKRAIPKPVTETVAPYQNPFPADGAE